MTENNKTINYLHIYDDEYNASDATSLYDFLTSHYSTDKLNNIKKIEFFSTENKIIGGDLSRLCPDLEDINVSIAEYNPADIVGCRNLTHITLEGIDFDSAKHDINLNLDLSVFENLKYFSITMSRNINSLEIINDNLQHIEMSENKIKKIILDCPKLRTLYATDNKLKNLEINSAPELYSVLLANNKLSKLDLSGAPNIKKLDLCANKFKSLDDIHGFYELKELRGLDIGGSGNPLTTNIYTLNELFPKLKHLFIRRDQDQLLNKINIQTDSYDTIDDCAYSDIERENYESKTEYYSGRSVQKYGVCDENTTNNE